MKRIKHSSLVRKMKNAQREIRRSNESRQFYNCGRYSYALSPELIKPDTCIGSFCSIARGVQIGPGKHPLSYLTTSPFSYYLRGEDKNIKIEMQMDVYTNSENCVIEDDVWIGTNAIIMEGIHIGRGAIIGANAVVTKDVPAYSIFGGVPAKLIKERFDHKTIAKIEKSKWWCYTDELLIDLPYDDVDKALTVLNQKVTEKRKESRNCCFIITSCIKPIEKPLCYSSVRTVYNADERLSQTKSTIESINKMCPGARIVLVDNGVEDYGYKIADIVDEYYYVGNKWLYKYFSSKDKGLGESIMLLYAIKKCKKDFETLFKISGRYTLTGAFDLAKYDLSRMNFLSYERGKIRTVGIAPYKEGSFSTRLYSIPKKYLSKYRKGLLKAMLFMFFRHTGIEYELPKRLNDEYYYHDFLGIQGCVGVKRNVVIEE